MKKVTFVLLSLLVVGGVMGAGVMTTAALGEGCPTGYVSVFNRMDKRPRLWGRNADQPTLTYKRLSLNP
jgi:hypothetical protein